MKTIINTVGSLFRDKKSMTWAAVMVSFMLLVAFGFNVLLQDTYADDYGTPGCYPRIDIHRDNILLDGNRTKVYIENKANEHDRDCTYDLTLATYKVFHPQGHPDFLSTQELFDHQTITLAPGEWAWLENSIPQCAFQSDLYFGQVIPNPENITSDRLLKWYLDESNLCVGGPEPKATIHVQSWVDGVLNPGASITRVSGPSDIGDLTQYSRSYNTAVSATLRAPETHKGGTFSHWAGCDGPTPGRDCNVSADPAGPDLRFVAAHYTTSTPPPPPGECVPNPRAHLLPAVGGVWNPFEGTKINILNSQASVGVKNISDKCTYTIHLASYNVFRDFGDSDFISTQTLFNSHTLTIGPGETKTLSTSLPLCRYQVDLFEGPNVPQTNPDFGASPLKDTHTLFDWFIDFSLEKCGVTPPPPPPPSPQCPSDFQTPVIAGAGQISVTSGDNVDYIFTVTGSGNITTTVTGLPSWLTFNPVTNKITGTVPSTFTGVITLTIKSVGVDPATGLTCGESTKIVKIIVSGPICPLDPPVLPESRIVTATVGKAFAFTIPLISGDQPITYTIDSGTLPPGLTLQGNKIIGTPTSAVTRDVVIKATNECGEDTMKLRIIVSTVTVPQCPADFQTPKITSGSQFDIRANRVFTYQITYTGDGDITVAVENLPSWLSFNSTTKVVSGTVPANRNYSFTVKVTARDGNLICGTDSLTVRLNPPSTGPIINPTPQEPRVRVVSQVITPPSGTVLGVSLVEVPYTGVGGTFQSIIFLIGLMVISSGLAYMIMSQRMREKLLGIVSFGRNTSVGNSNVTPTRSYDFRVDEYGNDITEHASVAYSPAHPLISGLDSSVADPMRQKKVEERFAQLDQSRNTSSEDSSDISSRVARELSALARKEEGRKEISSTKNLVAVNEDADTLALESKIEEAARGYKALISNDGVKLLVKSANADEANSMSILTELVKVADEWYEREDGWLLLNQDRVREILFTTYVMMVPSFISWIAEGNEEKVFGFAKTIQSQGHSIKEFMKNVVYELDALYRYKTEGSTSDVNKETLKIAGRWDISTVEKMIESFIGAVDGSYSNDFTPVKLSLLRAMSLAKEENRG